MFLGRVIGGSLLGLGGWCLIEVHIAAHLFGYFVWVWGCEKDNCIQFPFHHVSIQGASDMSSFYSSTSTVFPHQQTHHSLPARPLRIKGFEPHHQPFREGMMSFSPFCLRYRAKSEKVLGTALETAES